MFASYIARRKAISSAVDFMNVLCAGRAAIEQIDTLTKWTECGVLAALKRRITNSQRAQLQQKRSVKAATLEAAAPLRTT